MKIGNTGEKNKNNLNSCGQIHKAIIQLQQQKTCASRTKKKCPIDRLHVKVKKKRQKMR